MENITEAVLTELKSFEDLGLELDEAGIDHLCVVDGVYHAPNPRCVDVANVPHVQGWTFRQLKESQRSICSECGHLITLEGKRLDKVLLSARKAGAAIAAVRKAGARNVLDGLEALELYDRAKMSSRGSGPVKAWLEKAVSEEELQDLLGHLQIKEAVLFLANRLNFHEISSLLGEEAGEAYRNWVADTISKASEDTRTVLLHVGNYPPPGLSNQEEKVFKRLYALDQHYWLIPAVLYSWAESVKGASNVARADTISASDLEALRVLHAPFDIRSPYHDLQVALDAAQTL